MTATTVRRTRKAPRATSTERSERIAALSDRLAAMVDSADEDEMAEWEARFERYSARNAMLIDMQWPGATVVRGFTAWLGEGRCVRKGETSKILILAPKGSRTDEPAADAAPAPDGSAATGKVHKFFGWVPVFEISQTDPLPVEPAGSGLEAYAGLDEDVDGNLVPLDQS